ncbi:MAG: HDOD domain-containing protein [Pseudomonadota bacterium]
MQESNSAKLSNFEKQLNAHHLPVLNTTLNKVKQKLSEKQFNYEQLGTLIYHDPMYLFNFLACANRHKQQKRPDSEEKIKTPKHASMLLGMDNIEKCISSLNSLKEIKTSLATKDNKALINKIEQIASRSLHCAYQARNLARLMHDSADEDVFLSALMMSLADLLVWYISPQQAQKYEQLIYTQAIPEIEAQLTIFGFKFSDLIYKIAPHWQLPELYITSLQTDVVDEAKKSIICIKLADKLSRLVDFGWYYQEVYDHIDYCALVTPFSAQRLTKEFHHTAASMSDNLKNFYQFCLPINFLILQAGKVPYYPVLSTPKKLPPKQINNQPFNLLQQKEKIQAAQPKPLNKLENASTLPTLIQITINYLFQSNKFDHVVLLLLDKAKIDLTIRIEKNKQTNSSIQKKINISKNKNLFSLLLQKPQPIFVKASEAEKYKNLLTSVITEVLPANEFFAKAIFYKNKPIGIFYVSNEHPLNTEDYSFFNKTLVRFENHLSRLG